MLAESPSPLETSCTPTCCDEDGSVESVTSCCDPSCCEEESRVGRIAPGADKPESRP